MKWKIYLNERGSGFRLNRIFYIIAMSSDCSLTQSKHSNKGSLRGREWPWPPDPLPQGCKVNYTLADVLCYAQWERLTGLILLTSTQQLSAHRLKECFSYFGAKNVMAVWSAYDLYLYHKKPSHRNYWSYFKSSSWFVLFSDFLSGV